MLPDWAFAQHGHGVVVVQADGTVIVLEFNEFLGRIASGAVLAEDTVISRIFTDGVRRRVGDLRVFALVRSGAVRTEDLPRRVPEGVLATGEAARALLRAIEDEPDADYTTLLRAVSAPPLVRLSRELLRAAAALTSSPPEELPRPASAPDPPPGKDSL